MIIRMISCATLFLLVAAILPGGASAIPSQAEEVPHPFAVVFPAQAGVPQAPQVILAVAIEAGYDHSCLINISHEVFCWGANDYGQLGSGVGGYASRPVRVTGLPEGAVAVSAGGRHTCAVTTLGAAKCWGAGGFGQLGNDKWQDSSIPVAVTGLSSGVRGISAGYQHTCAVLDSGAARCWGSGSDGQLGDGLASTTGHPVTPTGLTGGVSEIGAGEEHTCARLGSSIKCWGDNYWGQLATGNQTWSSTPVNTVAMGGPAAQLAVGHFGNCIRTTGGGVQCWGFRAIVGDGTSVCYNGVGSNGDPWVTSPRWIVNMSNSVTDVAVGLGHACAVKSGGAFCWGDGRQGQLGNGATPNPEVCTPVSVTGLTSGVDRVSVGKNHTVALLAGSPASASIMEDELGVRSWGVNTVGQLGDGTTDNATTPVQVLPPLVFVRLPVVLR